MAVFCRRVGPEAAEMRSESGDSPENGRNAEEGDRMRRRRRWRRRKYELLKVGSGPGGGSYRRNGSRNVNISEI